MSTFNPLRAMFSNIVRGTKDEPAATVLDSVTKAKAAEAAAAASLLDAASDENGIDSHVDADIRLKVAAAIQQWAETDDLDEGEGFADRLLGLLVGIADVDMDGEIGDDEADLIELAAEAAWDYMSGKGVSEDDLSALLNDWDNEVGATVHELVISKLPSGEEESAADIDDFAFGDGADEAALDATYRKKVVVRKGKKVRINKRVAGTVRLSAKQKMAVRKMLRKSHSAKATMRRAKSNRVRKSMGL